MPIITVIGGALLGFVAFTLSASIVLGKMIYRTGTWLDERGMNPVFSDEHIDAAISKLDPMHWREGDKVIHRYGGGVVIFVEHMSNVQFLGEVPGPLWHVFRTEDFYLLEMNGVEYSE